MSRMKIVVNSEEEFNDPYFPGDKSLYSNTHAITNDKYYKHPDATTHIIHNIPGTILLYKLDNLFINKIRYNPDMSADGLGVYIIKTYNIHGDQLDMLEHILNTYKNIISSKQMKEIRDVIIDKVKTMTNKISVRVVYFIRAESIEKSPIFKIDNVTIYHNTNIILEEASESFNLNKCKAAKIDLLVYDNYNTDYYVKVFNESIHVPTVNNDYMSGVHVIIKDGVHNIEFIESDKRFYNKEAGKLEDEVICEKLNKDLLTKISVLKDIIENYNKEERDKYTLIAHVIKLIGTIESKQDVATVIKNLKALLK